jgi:hypothetical protein
VVHWVCHFSCQGQPEVLSDVPDQPVVERPEEVVVVVAEDERKRGIEVEVGWEGDWTDVIGYEN